MTTGKIFMMTVIFSLLAHIAVLGTAGFLEGNGATEAEDAFTVTLERNRDKKAEANSVEEKNPVKPFKGKVKSPGYSKVDTVDLESKDTKYRPYLLEVRKDINEQWRYPDDSFIRGEVGTTVVEFAIAREGGLADCRTVLSSGYESLDSESLRAVRSAAPFSPLSDEYGLAQLNIVASFRYKLAD